GASGGDEAAAARRRARALRRAACFCASTSRVVFSRVVVGSLFEADAKAVLSASARLWTRPLR
ncbi:MAG: hypothetical protein AAGH48_11185, partial [Pseudomonadota bacterium]